MSKISELQEPTVQVCNFLIDKSSNKPVGEKYAYMEVAKLVTAYTASLTTRITDLEAQIESLKQGRRGMYE